MTINIESESKFAFDSGYNDAINGKERQNASDVFGPFNGDYYSGYYEGQKVVQNTPYPDMDDIK